jgi:hypothetical protein
MKNLKTLFVIIFIFSSGQIYSQYETFTNCNSFDSNLLHTKIDTNGIWEIGNPNKQNFNSSYTGDYSIVTKLDSLYPTNDTSTFIMSYYTWQFGGIPNYLDSYEPLVIEFTHRFITDSSSDFGKIEMSLDNGSKWYDVLSAEHNANFGSSIQNFHYFENTGDTIFDSLSVFGNSNGWVHSTFSKEIQDIIWNDGLYPDSIMVKFTFISDSAGTNEGWQIDNLCMSMNLIASINEVSSSRQPTIFPNPNNGTFVIKDIELKNGLIEIFDLKGLLVYSQQIISKDQQKLKTELKSGMYIVKIGNGKTKQVSRLNIK